jgi:hypothetical protein
MKKTNLFLLATLFALTACDVAKMQARSPASEETVYIDQSSLDTDEAVKLRRFRPVAENLSVSTNANTAVTIDLIAKDPQNDPLTFKISSMPINGSVSISGSKAIYTPKSNFSGSDSFSYVAYDGQYDSQAAKVSITVNAAPVIPPSTTPLPAFVTSITSSSSGAVVTLSGPVQGLRYFYDSSGGSIDLPGPYNSPYTITKAWPAGTTFVCAQAKGTDGNYYGTAVGDLQTCTSVSTSAPPPAPTPATLGSATLSWDANTESDLAYYKIYYGTSSSSLSNMISNVAKSSAPSYVVNNLSTGITYYFAVTAVNTSGLESDRSLIVSKTP